MKNPVALLLSFASVVAPGSISFAQDDMHLNRTIETIAREASGRAAE